MSAVHTIRIAAALALLALAGVGVQTSAATTPADTAATRAYLQAAYRLDQTVLRNASASRAAATSFVERLGHECRGVLAGAPSEAAGEGAQPGPRQAGEYDRSIMQRATIEEELALSFSAALGQPDRAALEAYAARVAQLSWSDQRIATLLRYEANDEVERLTPPVSSVCAEMRSWAQSAFHVLPAGSLSFEASRSASENATHPSGSVGPLLKPSEGHYGRVLIRRIDAVRVRIRQALEWEARLSSSLRRTLGAPLSPYEEHETEPVLGRGTTSVGERFVVRRERRGSERSCRSSVSVTLEGRHGGSSTSSACVSGEGARHPSSACGGGVEKIEMAVPASVWTVRMRLSNGRTITSPAIRISRREGGPVGLYVQAVRGYSPYPVSLTELDRAGGTVAVVSLKAFRCEEESPASGPTFIELASGTSPEGVPFTIQGTIVHYGHDQTSFLLGVEVVPNSPHEVNGSEQAKPRAYSWSLALDCAPHEFAVLDGILSTPGDSVLARTPEGLVPLTEVALASDLHAGGSLVYGVFSTSPSEIVVRDSAGATVYSESLAKQDQEQAAFCQGYEER